VREFRSEVRLLGCFSRCICLSVSLQDLLFNGPYCKFHQRLVVFEGLTTGCVNSFSEGLGSSDQRRAAAPAAATGNKRSRIF
jgi:hypothetical protein